MSSKLKKIISKSDTIDISTNDANLDKEIVNCMNLLTQINDSNDSMGDFFQLQINNLNKKLNDIKKSICKSKEKYCKITQDIINLNNIVSTNIINTKTELICNTQNLYYIDTSKIHQYIFTCDTIIFITMVGGGGAGGIGFIKDMYYYGGGGGGAGSCIIKKPVKVTIGTIMNIKVGKGGNAKTNQNGEPSYVELYIKNGKETIKEIITVNGGQNGYPTINYEQKVDGGKGGISVYCECFVGHDGQDGTIAIPSVINSCGGNGGNSIVYVGGNGGSNYFCIGGNGGNICEIIVGKDGSFGSGGGGSAPTSKIDICKEKISGNGGDGMVIIEYTCECQDQKL